MPYVIYINGTNPQFASMLEHQGPPPLVEQIRAYGGDYFDAVDPDALARAYAAIDARVRRCATRCVTVRGGCRFTTGFSSPAWRSWCWSFQRG